jgi:inositol 3-alpha-galactosyltransferase
MEGHAHGRILPMQVDLLLPRAGQENRGSVAERFKDTFTKLRAFQVHKLGFTQAAFLDADMAVFRNPDKVFDVKLPGRNWLGANHICCYNLDKDS